MLGLKGPRKTLEFSLRVDLPGEDHEEELVRYLADVAAHHGVSHVMVVIYADDVCPGELPRRVLAEALVDAVECRGLSVLETLCVSGDRWFAYSCSDPNCCPPGGTAIDHASVVSATAVSEGLVARSGRAELEASLAPGPDRVREQTRLAIESYLAEVDALIDERGRSTDIDLLSTWGGALDEVERRPPATITADQAARLLVALRDWRVRDLLLLEWDRGWVRELLAELTRRAPQGFVAAPAGSYACAAYLKGRGAAANIALDRCFADDPKYSLGLLIAQAIQSAVDPRLMRKAWSADVLPTPGRKAQRRRTKRRSR